MSIWRGECEATIRCAIRTIVNEALCALEREFTALYARIDRPSIAPEKLLRAMLLQAFYSIRSERQLMERLEFDLHFRCEDLGQSPSG
jgi:transposase